MATVPRSIIVTITIIIIVMHNKAHLLANLLIWFACLRSNDSPVLLVPPEVPLRLQWMQMRLNLKEPEGGALTDAWFFKKKLLFYYI